MSSLLERIAQTKRQQAAARAGEVVAPVADAVVEGTSVATGAGAASPPAGTDLAADFEALLQIIGRHYQYDQDDFSAMRALQADTSEAGRADLARTIHEWRLELVSQGLTDQLDDGAAQRCWQALGGASTAAAPHTQTLPADQAPRRAMPAL